MMGFKEQFDEAERHLKNGNRIQAERIYDDVLGEDENNADALFGKAECLFNRCRYDEALELCDRARQIDSDSIPDVFYNQLILAVDANSKDYRRNASRHSHLRDYKSKECPNCGHSINPFFVICPVCDFDLRDLHLYEVCGKCGRIIDDTDGICRNCEDDAMPHESAASVIQLCDEGFGHIENYRIKEAKICFDRASRIDSKDANPIAGSAYCFYHLGYYVLALKKCDEALKLDSESIDEVFYNKVKSKADSVKGRIK